MILKMILAQIPPWAIGCAAIFLCRRWHRNTVQPLFIYSLVALCLGLGISSCLFFLWMLCFEGHATGYFVFEGILAAAVGLTAFRWGAAVIEKGTLSLPFGEAPPERSDWIFTVGFLAVLVARVAYLCRMAFEKPHGGWDAWVIWNLRARYLYWGFDNWKDAMSPILAFHHPDYPLLLPLTITRSWLWLENDTVAVPATVALMFTLGTSVLLYAAIAFLRREKFGFLAGLVLLWTPSFITLGPLQYADVPLGFFFLATIVAMYFGMMTLRGGNAFLVLAGLASALAAWTKNEGILFVLAVFASFAFWSWLRRREGGSFRRLLFLLAGMLPILLIVLYFKWQLAPPTDLWAESDANSLPGRLLSAGRFWQASVLYAGELLTFSNWGFRDLPFVTPLPLLALFIFFSRTRLQERERQIMYATALIIVMMLMGYFGIFLLTPLPLTWHLETAAGRLFLQLWPACLFIYFAFIGKHSQR